MPWNGPWEWLRADPRHGQIAALALLFTYGVGWLAFDITGPQAAATIGTALAVQALADTVTGRGRLSGAKSALISSLSLCLLLRTDHLWLAATASAIAVLSKFLIRVRDKHVFNPTNLALVALLLTTDAAWVSPGQWGTQAVLAFGFACAGLLVVHRAERSDVTIAFLAVYAGLVFARSTWLGEPMTIPLHRLESGAFLLFAFFMISDPRTTPDSRAGRVIFATVVAVGAAYVHFRLFRSNGFLWSLALASPFVPLLDRLLPAARYHWPSTVRSMADSLRRSSMVRRVACVLFGVLGLASTAATAEAFCGFYVARADTRLFNKASQVVLVRDGDRTVLTMANDFRGDLREFAMVIPVPTSITRDQIHVGDKALLDHLDAFTAPRLVEYFDTDPCARMERRQDLAFPMAASPSNEVARRAGARSLGVTIEAQYTVGEYDILILSATQSSGLEQWLRQNGYRIPAGATGILGTYIKQNMRFFVARVNLGEQAKLGYSSLRPLQVAYESPKFMLPIRLGMVNADGAQELFVYALTRKGRIETTNYRTVKLRTDVEIPTYLKDPAEFGRMYRAMFARQVQQEQMRAVFLEYAWDMAWCDPCAADPLTADELRRLGVFWLNDDTPIWSVGPPPPSVRPPARPQDVFVTRLHVRYDQAHFPEDLAFQETGDRSNFQGRYVLRHAWKGPVRCEAAEAYMRSLPERHEREAQTLVSLTGWAIDEIRTRMGLSTRGGPVVPAAELPWWKRVWGSQPR
jgi:Na+-translocating ferredoxin:NAD+ oxidoreductase RnfD subunit